MRFLLFSLNRRGSCASSEGGGPSEALPTGPCTLFSISEWINSLLINMVTSYSHVFLWWARKLYHLMTRRHFESLGIIFMSDLGTSGEITGQAMLIFYYSTKKIPSCTWDLVKGKWNDASELINLRSGTCTWIFFNCIKRVKHENYRWRGTWRLEDFRERCREEWRGFNTRGRWEVHWGIRMQSDGKEHKQSKVNLQEWPSRKEPQRSSFSLCFLFICLKEMQVQCTTKSQHQAMESRRVEAAEEEEEERAVQRGGLRVRPLNHSQVFVVTQSGVSVQSSINRVEWCCESDFRFLRGWGWGEGVNLTRIQLSSVSTQHPLADINAHCNHRNYASPQLTGLHQMHSTIMHGCTSFPPNLQFDTHIHD